MSFYQATFTRPAPDSLQVSLTGALRTKVDSDGANVMVALYENGLVTDCPRGENKGRVLSNDYVVRKLEKLCTVKDISAKKTVSGMVNFPLWEGFKSSKCGLAVFVQSKSHQIFGSQSFQLPDDIWFWFFSFIWSACCYHIPVTLCFVRLYVQIVIWFRIINVVFFLFLHIFSYVLCPSLLLTLCLGDGERSLNLWREKFYWLDLEICTYIESVVCNLIVVTFIWFSCCICNFLSWLFSTCFIHTFDLFFLFISHTYPSFEGDLIQNTVRH